MKKRLVIALLLAAVSSQAVSFTWNSGGTKISFDGATTLAAAGKITATLIYLGTDTSASIEDYKVSNGFEAQSVSTVSTGFATSRGIYTATFDKSIDSKFENGATFSGGDYFTVLLSYKDEKGTQWYNLASSAWQVPAGTADNDQIGPASFSHSFTMKTKGTALSAGGGWVAVPEPSTAALALAGLALLLKRRKA